MKTLKKIAAVALAAVVVVLVLSLFVGANTDTPSLGGIGEGPFRSVKVTSSNSNDNLVLGGSGALGKIIVASSSASAFSVYDGTATTTGTLLVTLPASIPQGEYEFDIAVRTGLIVDGAAGFNGDYVITYQ